MAEALAGLAHSGGIDQRHDGFDVVDEHPVEQGFIAVLQGDQGDVALQVVILVAQDLQDALLLVRG